MKQRPLKVIHAAAVRDAQGVNARPGAVLVADGKVLAAGEPDSLPAELVAQAVVIDRRGCLLLPAMVNAHSHLELTDIGPRPYAPAGGFIGWVKALRSAVAGIERGKGDGANALLDSVRRGAEQCRSSGVQAVGDISGSAAADGARAASGLSGVTYLELFGLGPPFDQAGMVTVRDAATGLQPHAPYSAGRSLFAAAAASGRPVTTHLAETLDEAAFVAELRGPWVEYLDKLGRWDDSCVGQYGNGLSPVQWMRPHLEAAADQGGWLVAHCNYVSDNDIAILAATNTSVAYCPIASEYFGHAGHRYRDMLDAGVNVCLGTDSIVCADPDELQPLGLLRAMRRLFERDQTEPTTLLALATTNGAKALRLPGNFATLQPSATAEFVCIAIDQDNPLDPLQQALVNESPVQPLSLTH